jgi:hypothetical protein
VTTEQVNYLNIVLMVVSAAAAFVIPFELFLFAYAVLGPLHYLTEISWLHDRSYFTKNKYDFLFLAALCLLLLVVTYVIKAKPDLETGIIATAFLSALVMVLIRSSVMKIVAIALIIVAVLVLKQLPAYQVFFAIFLPTLMHVFVFTGAFILMGALKGKSRSGIVSLAVFAACAASFFLPFAGSLTYEVTDYVRQSYASFRVVNVAMIRTLRLGTLATADDVYTTQAGFVAMRFIAFAYLYHYLNWFSKTSVIKWNQISNRRRAVIGAIWLGALALYGYDYRIGIVALFFLSFLHVFLEFPLDHQTLMGLGKELLAVVRR